MLSPLFLQFLSSCFPSFLFSWAKTSTSRYIPKLNIAIIRAYPCVDAFQENKTKVCKMCGGLFSLDQLLNTEADYDSRCTTSQRPLKS